MISEIFILFYNIFIANFCDLKIYKKGLPKSMTIFDFWFKLFKIIPISILVQIKNLYADRFFFND